MIEDEFAGHKQHTRPRARSARGPDRGVAMHTYVCIYLCTYIVVVLWLYNVCTLYIIRHIRTCLKWKFEWGTDG